MKKTLILVASFTRLLPIGLPGLCFSYGHAIEFNQTWQASSGLMPEQACPAWAAFGSSASLSDGMLTISTISCDVHQFYIQSPIAIPDPIVVEARLRTVSDTTCGPCFGDIRQAVTIAVTTAPSTGAALHIGIDEMFLTTSETCPSAIISTLVDTNDVFHTYRMEVAASGAVTVYYDESLALMGQTYVAPNDHGPTPRVLWGEASAFAHGVSEWQVVRHNAHPSGCDQDGDGARIEIDCDDLDSCSWPGAMEICDLKDNNCDQVIDETPVSPPGPVAGLRLLSAGGPLEWLACGNSVYDVVKGDLVALRSTSGDYTASTDMCLEDDSLDTSTPDPEVPAMASGFYYLVRANAICGPGTYDSGGPGQVGTRDPEINSSPMACP